jgi:hypothetical protein
MCPVHASAEITRVDAIANYRATRRRVVPQLADSDQAPLSWPNRRDPVAIWCVDIHRSSPSRSVLAKSAATRQVPEPWLIPGIPLVLAATFSHQQLVRHFWPVPGFGRPSLREPAGSTFPSTLHSTCPKREEDKVTPIAGRHFIFFLSASTYNFICTIPAQDREVSHPDAIGSPSRIVLSP